MKRKFGMKLRDRWILGMASGGLVFFWVFGGGIAILDALPITVKHDGEFGRTLTWCIVGIGFFSMALGFYHAWRMQHAIARLHRHPRHEQHPWARECLREMCASAFCGTLGGVVFLGTLYQAIVVGHI